LKTFSENDRFTAFSQLPRWLNNGLPMAYSRANLKKTKKKKTRLGNRVFA
jgi:hypothetical protein